MPNTIRLPENRQKVKANAENAHVWCKHKLTDVYAIYRCELPQ